MTGESPLWLRLVPSLNFTNSLNPSGSSPIRGVKSSRILFGRLAGGKIKWIVVLTLAMTGETALWLRLVPSLNFTNSLNPSDSSPIRGAKSARILFGRLAGGKIMDCYADARNDRALVHEFTKVFSRVRR